MSAALGVAASGLNGLTEVTRRIEAVRPRRGLFVAGGRDFNPGALKANPNPRSAAKAVGVAASPALLAAVRPAVLPLIQACAALQPALVPAGGSAERVEEAAALKPELAFYRKYTEAMLRRYQTLSMESGRVPSLLGREMFQGRVTSYKVRAFDDVVIFCHDVGRCIERLEAIDQRLITRVALQEYTFQEATGLLSLSLRTVIRRYGNAIDQLTGLFLERGLLDPLAGVTARMKAAVEEGGVSD